MFIQFLNSLILSWPQALLDYHPYIDRRLKYINGKVEALSDDHGDIIMKGIESRMDLYKLLFLLSQIVAPFFLMVKVHMRNKEWNHNTQKDKSLKFSYIFIPLFRITICAYIQDDLSPKSPNLKSG